jgi:hypothetical protein
MAASDVPDAPDYDMEIAADELLADLAEEAAEYGRDVAEKARWQREAPAFDPYTKAMYWELEALGGRTAYAKAIATLQPENSLLPSRNFREADGTVDVRAFMAWLSKQADAAHEDSYGDYTETRQASEAETAYARMLSTLRDDYGVGWPRLDDLGGNPLECDLP